MMQLYLLALFMASAAALVVSCFCRAAHTSKANTRRPIRWTFSALGALAGACLFAPVLTSYRPDAMATALLAMLALTQVVTSHYWRVGVPKQFRKDST